MAPVESTTTSHCVTVTVTVGIIMPAGEVGRGSLHRLGQMIAGMQSAGLTLREIAAAQTDSIVKTPRGGARTAEELITLERNALAIEAI